MQAADRQNSVGSANRELLGLLLASIACVCVLTVSLTENRGGDGVALDVRLALLLMLLIGAAATAFGVAYVATLRANRVVHAARGETATLRNSLMMAESIIRAEPQVVVFWDPGQSLKVVAHTLSGVPGLPADQRALLAFGGWLEQQSADELKAGLELLFQTGRPLSLLLKTREGAHLEADGRAAGSRAVLRLRDVAAYKRDLVRILEQHRQLTSDVQAGRDLLDALPMPDWQKGADGRIAWANQSYVAAVEARDLGEVRERELELLGQRQRKAVTAALAVGKRYASRLNLVLNCERKAHDVIVTSTDRTVSAIAVDVTALERMQSELNRQLSTYDRTLDRVRTAGTHGSKHVDLILVEHIVRKRAETIEKAACDRMRRTDDVGPLAGPVVDVVPLLQAVHLDHAQIRAVHVHIEHGSREQVKSLIACIPRLCRARDPFGQRNIVAGHQNHETPCGESHQFIEVRTDAKVFLVAPNKELVRT